MTPPPCGEPEPSKTTEQLIKELQEFKYALDTSAIVAITDLNGDITYANSKFCEISKFNYDELIGKNHRIINSGYHSREFFTEMWDTISQGDIWEGEIRNKTKDGTYYWVDTTIIPMINQQGQPYQYISIRFEITQRKQMEEEIRQLNSELEKRVAQRTRDLQTTVEKLKDSERVRETFISALTHDLRTPLVAQQRAFELLVNQKESLPQKLAGLAERLLKSNHDLLDMVNKLLEIHHYEAGEANLRVEEVRLTNIVDECIEHLAVLAEEKAITLTNQLGNNCPAIQADNHQLKRVFINLIGNALENIPSGSTVQVHLRETQPSLVIEVEDNGQGITPDVLPHLFNRYFVVRRTRKKIGTGLGLYICKMILELHGGQIEAFSTMGEGTRFRLTLPYRQNHDYHHTLEPSSL